MKNLLFTDNLTYMLSFFFYNKTIFYFDLYNYFFILHNNCVFIEHI